jgi:hypothetical protein
MGLRDVVIDRKALLRISILTILFAGMGGFVLWGYARVEGDFTRVKTLLQDTRYRAMSKDKMLVVRFSGKEVTVMDGKTGMVLSALTVPTLNEVNYDTTFGDDTIVFDGHGTSNKRVHGGDVRLRSWLGFRKNIAVNCTGLVTEGVYPGEF